MKKILADEWSAIRKWWSLWVGLVSMVLLTAVPIVADRWPDLAPTVVALFPEKGTQVVPIIGLLLTIAARLISQRALLDMLKTLFRPKGGDNGPDHA